MTAYGTMDTAIDAMAAGFSGFLRKPFILPGTGLGSNLFF